jgi:hypothetical protein
MTVTTTLTRGHLDHIVAGIAAWNARCAEQDPDILEIQPEPAVWSIKQNTWHLADAFEATTIRLKSMLAEQEPQLLRFDADEWAADRDYQGRPWHEAIAKLNQQLGRLLELCEDMSERDLGRTGRQHNIAVNIMGRDSDVLTAADLLDFESAHVDEHTASIELIIARFGPH